MVYFFVPSLARSGVVFNALGISAVVAILVGVRVHRPIDRLPWMLFALAQGLFVAGDVFYYTLPGIFHYSVDFPSLGDVFYLAVGPLVISGLVLLIRSRTGGRDLDALIDALIIGVGVGVVSWVFLMVPYATADQLPLGSKAVSILYPLMDVLMLAFMVRLVVGGGRRQPVFYLLLVGMLALVTTDSIYGFIELNGTYHPGSWLDVGWLLYYFSWGAAALHPSMRRISEPIANHRTALSRWRLAALTGAALLAPAVEATRLGSTQLSTDSILVGGTIAMFILVIVRLRTAIRRHAAAEERERSLRDAGSALVTASTPGALHQAALSAARGLVPDAGVAIYLTGNDLTDLDPIGLDEETTPRRQFVFDALPPALQEQLLGGRSATLTRVSERSNTESEADGNTRTILIAPMMAQARVIGLVVVESKHPVDPAVRGSVDALASQIALAFEAARDARVQHRRLTEERVQSLVRNSSDIVTVVDADGIITYQSPSILDILGLDPAALVGNSVFDYIDPADRASAADLAARSRDRTGRAQVLTTRWRDAAGAWRNVEIRWSVNSDPSLGGAVLNTRDVSERQAFEQKLTYTLLHDPVTQLANRSLFRDRVELTMATSARRGSSFAVVCVSLDDFKLVNQGLGYQLGDQLLIDAARRISETLRSSDTIARLAGGEFALLLEEVDAPQAATIVDELREVLASPFIVDGRDVVLTVSAGFTTPQASGGSSLGADDLIRDAALACEVSTKHGSTPIVLFERSMRDSAELKLSLIAEMQRAVANQEFQLQYQPVIELQTGRAVGVEALLRWQHPTRGLVSPAEFIPLAEESGLIVPIGRWALDEACESGARLQRIHGGRTPFSIAVNLSAKQLEDDGLVNDVARAIARSGIEPRGLVLEITESLMMDDPARSAARLGELAALGVELAIDDFGTGFSSLSYLQQFPVNVLKIDKSFVDRVDGTNGGRAIAHAIVQLASAFDLRVVAEGIERQSQLDSLARLGCRFGQGFLMARPMTLDPLHGFLRERAVTGHRRRIREPRTVALATAA